ncbi:hypothetical protein JCM9279_003370, partial [Rhodotorula babjevae]
MRLSTFALAALVVPLVVVAPHPVAQDDDSTLSASRFGGGWGGGGGYGGGKTAGPFDVCFVKGFKNELGCYDGLKCKTVSSYPVIKRCKPVHVDTAKPWGMCGTTSGKGDKA